MSEVNGPDNISGNNTSEDIVASEPAGSDLTKMTREQALEYMGLGPDADIKEIDDRFWQMSKQFRGKTDPESLAKEDEISAVYDIASGRRDERVKEEIEFEAETKYFGKTKGQWKNFFEYTWYIWFLGVIIVVLATVGIIGMVNNQKHSCSIVVFGHMYFDNSYMTEALIENGIELPYIGNADIIVPNDEGLSYSETGNSTLDALLYTEPVVLIADKESYPYYYSIYKDLSPIADQIMNGLTDEAKEYVVPVYMSRREAIECQNKLFLSYGYDKTDLEDPNNYPDDKILIGFELKDPALAARLGVDCIWKSRETTLVFCQWANSKDDERAVKIITTIINSAFKETAET